MRSGITYIRIFVQLLTHTKCECRRHYLIEWTISILTVFHHFGFNLPAPDSGRLNGGDRNERDAQNDGAERELPPQRRQSAREVRQEHRGRQEVPGPVQKSVVTVKLRSDLLIRKQDSEKFER